MSLLHKFVFLALIFVSTFNIYKNERTNQTCFEFRESQVWLKTDWLKVEGTMIGLCVNSNSRGRHYE